MNVHTKEWYLWQVLCTHAVERLIRIQLLVWVDKKMSCGQSKDHRALRCLFLYMFMLCSCIGVCVFFMQTCRMYTYKQFTTKQQHETTHNAAHAQTDVIKYNVLCGNAK